MTLKGSLTFDVARYLFKKVLEGYLPVRLYGIYARHEFELSVWRNETDGARLVKLCQTHTLVKPAVIQFNSVNGSMLALVYDEFVVETEFAFRRPR